MIVINSCCWKMVNHFPDKPYVCFSDIIFTDVKTDFTFYYVCASQRDYITYVSHLKNIKTQSSQGS